MGKTWISVACALGLAGCAMGEPKQSWDRPHTTTAKQEAKPEEPKAEKGPSHEEVCRKMWSMIDKEASEAAAKAKNKKGKKPKLPTEEDQKEFLDDCIERGTKQQKEEPKTYECLRTCILESETTKEVETCGKACP